MGVRLNQEKGYTRFRYICEFLADAGYEVDLITTTFQHWEKEQRDLEKIKADDYKFGLKFIYEPGYKKRETMICFMRRSLRMMWHLPPHAMRKRKGFRLSWM